MEGKTVIMTTLLLSLILGQIQVQAIVMKTCCPPTNNARIVYNACVLLGNSIKFCESITGCINIVVTEECPVWNHDILENTGDNAVNEYCKLGCASSVCGAITTLQNSDASEVVNGAIEKCTKACSALCTKGITAVKTA